MAAPLIFAPVVLFLVRYLTRLFQVSPFTIPALLGNTASGVIGIECGCQGPNYGVTSACASGSHAIGEAMGMIQDGHVDRMLAGGAEGKAIVVALVAHHYIDNFAHLILQSHHYSSLFRRFLCHEGHEHKFQ